MVLLIQLKRSSRIYLPFVLIVTNIILQHSYVNFQVVGFGLCRRRCRFHFRLQCIQAWRSVELSWPLLAASLLPSLWQPIRAWFTTAVSCSELHYPTSLLNRPLKWVALLKCCVVAATVKSIPTCSCINCPRNVGALFFPRDLGWLALSDLGG